MVEHISASEDVATLEIPYDQIQPLQIPYDMSLMTIFVNPIVLLVIIVPTPFPYEDTKAMPWIYDSIIYLWAEGTG